MTTTGVMWRWMWLLRDWLWGRAEVDGYTVVAASVRFQEHMGGVETPLLYIAKDNEKLLGVFNDQLTCLEGVKGSPPRYGQENQQRLYLPV